MIGQIAYYGVTIYECDVMGMLKQSLPFEHSFKRTGIGWLYCINLKTPSIRSKFQIKKV